MMIRPIHPFPARMAPHLAIAELNQIPKGSIVLDPMAGSGTVLRQASELGHTALGFDMDPLAVLMTRVWTTPVDEVAVDSAMEALLKNIKKLRLADVALPWIDEDSETTAFCHYWFGRPQLNDLRKLSFALEEMKRRRHKQKAQTAIDLLQIALSRIIITKDQGASLARDVSHSRPHKVADQSEFKVFEAFQRSVATVRQLLASAPPTGNVTMERGDARHLESVRNRSIDLVLTSPPYLNAIDYMRGHRLALVWIGHRLVDLRQIRSSSIGTERGPDSDRIGPLFEDIERAMVRVEKLTSRHAAMVARYAEDLYRMMSEIKRVLRPGGTAVLVVGNSCLKGAFIRNSAGVTQAASMVGLSLRKKVQRRLPTNRRYLPLPSATTAPLGGRMRTESILTFSA
jgi:tRNA G10  N-methylase Trm11